MTHVTWKLRWSGTQFLTVSSASVSSSSSRPKLIWQLLILDTEAVITTLRRVIITPQKACPIDCILHPTNGVSGSASKSSIQRFVITEKAPTKAFSWLKLATTAFTFKTLLRHYAKQALTPRSLNVKLGPRRNYHKGRAVRLAMCLIATCPCLLYTSDAADE